MPKCHFPTWMVANPACLAASASVNVVCKLTSCNARDDGMGRRSHSWPLFPSTARTRGGHTGGNGSGALQEYAGMVPQPSALKMHSRLGVRPVKQLDRVGLHTAEPE